MGVPDFARPLGTECGSVTDFERVGPRELTVSCEDGRRFRVSVAPAGEVKVEAM